MTAKIKIGWRDLKFSENFHYDDVNQSWLFGEKRKLLFITIISEFRFFVTKLTEK